MSAFKFTPMQCVTVTFNDLNYRGRILRCIYDGALHIYKVQYSDDKGDLKADEFYEDELRERNV
jgi:hypothetical protein